MKKQHFIANSWISHCQDESIAVIDPSNGNSLGDIARGNEQDVDAAVAAARTAIGDTFDGPWGRLRARGGGGIPCGRN